MGPYFKIPHDLAPTWLQGIDVSLTFYSCLVVKSNNGQGVIHYTNGVRYKPMHHIIIRRLKKIWHLYIYNSNYIWLTSIITSAKEKKNFNINKSPEWSQNMSWVLIQFKDIAKY